MEIAEQEKLFEKYEELKKEFDPEYQFSKDIEVWKKQDGIIRELIKVNSVLVKIDPERVKEIDKRLNR